MCIQYSVEFWTPHANPSADVERRVLRGITEPGLNRPAKKRQFWLHNGQYFSGPQCPSTDVREGGYYYNRIFEFCFDDVDCRQRLEQFADQYEHCRAESQRAEARREPEGRQKWLNEQWLRAYNDWVSAYDNHKDCPQTRMRHEHFAALHRAGVCIGMFGLPDRLRLGRNPTELPMPSGTGFERGSQPPKRRA